MILLNVKPILKLILGQLIFEEQEIFLQRR